MKTIAILLAGLLTFGVVAADEMSIEQWNELNQRAQDLFGEYARQVAAGEATPIKCATPLFLQVQMSQPAGVAYKPTYTDREDTMSYTYGTTHFLLHYTDTGPNEVYQFATQTLDPPHPDYIVQAGAILEEVYQKEVTAMGFPPPLSDVSYDTENDGRMDVYFINFGAYGATVRERIDTSQAVWRGTAYMFLENDYEGFIGYENNRLNALRVTAAHEYFHTVQFAIDVQEVEATAAAGDINASWMEMSATYMEEENYDNVNDYYSYLPFFYEHPQWALNSGTYMAGQDYIFRNLHMYGIVVWPLYLAETFGPGIIKTIWDLCGRVSGPNWIASTETAIDSLSAGTMDSRAAFREFTLWNLFTAHWARPAEYFSEGNNYPPLIYQTAGMPGVAIAAQVSSYPATITVHDTLLPENMGANYILLNNVVSQPAGLAVSFSPDRTRPWSLQVVGLPENVSSGAIFIDSQVYDSSTETILIPNAPDFHRIVLIPAVTGGHVLSGTETGYDYTITVSSLGEGVSRPNGGEQLYAGTTYDITWFFEDSVSTVTIELSLDNGETWETIATMANAPHVYTWTVPETPSTSCLIRITNADNTEHFDVSDATFSIITSSENRVADPYPNPAWIGVHDAVVFKGVIATGNGETDMSVSILTLAGERVAELYGGTQPGQVVIRWDFTNADGETVAAGPYLAVIEFAGETVVKKFMVFR